MVLPGQGQAESHSGACGRVCVCVFNSLHLDVVLI